MKDIQIREIERTAKLLHGMGCQFKIITPDGAEYGELLAVQKKRANRFKPGELSSVYAAQIDLSFPVGEVQQVHIGAFPVRNMHSCICAYLTQKWGSNTYTTHANGDVIEIMRTA